MCPCVPPTFSAPTGPSGPALPGFGVPFSLPLPTIPFPAGFPEDLLDLLNKLELLIPPGALLPQLNPNFGKDIFDAIMKLLDQFMPFLMLYKFFLPILNLIICIIEVLCALVNPFKLISALERLFTQCIPAFLNLFPIFALIIMIIALLLLILALIEYIINQIITLILIILRNINAIVLAFQQNDASGIIMIAAKLGALLCVFQNLFVLFAIFNVIIEIIKDILSNLFAIPPCQGGDNSNCCSPDVCPEIVSNVYTNSTGTFVYYPQVGVSFTPVPPPPAGTPASLFSFAIRNENWQLYDLNQTQAQAFSNIYDAYDVVAFYNADGYALPVPVYFPTDANYTAATAPAQAPYQLNLRFHYDPAQFPGRVDPLGARFIRFNMCIMSQVPNPTLLNYDNSTTSITNGVATIVGGLGYEDDGTTILRGYEPDGTTPLPGPLSLAQASLENFVHLAPVISSTSATLSPGITFTNMTYTFTPNIAPLIQANLITLGCAPTFAFNKEFINTAFAGNAAVQGAQLNAIINAPTFPNPAAAQQCMQTAVNILRNNMTAAGVADFQATTMTCLTNLQSATKTAIGDIIGIGFDPCSSSFTLDPNLQFTTQPIVVSVNIAERNGLPLAKNLPADLAATIATQITGYPTLGTIGTFAYDGYQHFNAQLFSLEAGSGSIMVSYNNQMLCTNTIPTDGSTPTHTLQNLPYQFVQAPGVPGTGEGDTTGLPRRDAGDLSRDSTGSE